MQALSRVIIGTADLRPVSSLNNLLQYADDSYLLIGSRNACSAHDEISLGNQKASSSQTIQNPGYGSCTPEGAFIGCRAADRGRKRSTTMNILGVTITERL